MRRTSSNQKQSPVLKKEKVLYQNSSKRYLKEKKATMGEPLGVRKELSISAL